MQNTQTQRHEEQVALRAEFLKAKAYIERVCQRVADSDELLVKLGLSLKAA